MIIGNGLIASLFKEEDRSDTVFFASGVSNSLETRLSEFKREEQLLKKIMDENPDKKILYFSTCSIYDSSKSESPYVLHKLNMEHLVSNHQTSYLVLRVSNVVGNGGNPNLLMNYLTRSVQNDSQITVHTKAKRNLINAEDVKNIVLQLIEQKKFNGIINLAYLENFSTIEILEELELFYETTLNLNLLPIGNAYEIDIPYAKDYFTKYKLTDKKSYLRKIINDYYKTQI